MRNDMSRKGRQVHTDPNSLINLIELHLIRSLQIGHLTDFELFFASRPNRISLVSLPFDFNDGMLELQK